MPTPRSVYLIARDQAESLLALLGSLPEKPKVTSLPDVAALLSRDPADLIILDADDLTDSSAALTRHAMEIYPQSSFLVSFSRQGAEWARELRQAGAYPLWKPYLLDEFYRAARQLLSIGGASSKETLRVADLPALVQGLSDEINNPLSTVSGYLQLLSLDLEENKKEEASEKFQAIQEGIDRIAVTMQQLAWAAGKQRPARTEFSWPTLIRERCKQWQASHAEVELQLEIGRGALSVLGDRKWISMALDQILAFATGVLDSGKSMHWSLEKPTEQGQARLDVLIPSQLLEESHLPQLFRPFAPDAAGIPTGLLLAAARGIAESHGGTLQATLESPGNLRLSLSLPVPA